MPKVIILSIMILNLQIRMVFKIIKYLGVWQINKIKLITKTILQLLLNL